MNTMLVTWEFVMKMYSIKIDEEIRLENGEKMRKR